MTRAGGDKPEDEARLRNRLSTLIAQTSLTTSFVEALAAQIRGAFPGRSLQDVLEKEILPEMLAQPEWVATNGGLKIGRGAVFNSGAFCIYYGDDPDTGKPVALLHIRKEAKPDGAHLLGAVGGYTKEPEQPIQGLAREFGEEICDHQGEPVITPEHGKYCLIDAGKDFSQAKATLPVEYTSYAYELSADEIRALKNHAHKLAKDGAYKKQCREQSEGETVGIRMLPLEDIVKMSPADFKYHRHYDTYREVASRLGLEVEGLVQGRKPGKVGYPVGGANELTMVRRVRHSAGRTTRFSPTGVEENYVDKGPER